MYCCMHCGYQYTPKPKEQGHSKEIRERAVKMYVGGMNFRKIGRYLGINHRTVSLWVKANATLLPEPPVPENVGTAEMDEIFTFIGDKKGKTKRFKVSLCFYH